MKYSWTKHIFPCFLTIIIVLSITMPAVAATKLYVNTGKDTLDAALDNSYAIGSGSAQKLTGNSIYALTGSGLVTVDENAASSIPVINVGDIGSTTINIKSDTVKIGLYYYYSKNRDSSVETSKLTNYVGKGFEFGYYNSDREFVGLGHTDETSLTVMKDTNVSVSGGTVGCYHIKLSDTYENFESARAEADNYSGAFPAYYNGKFYVLVGNYTSGDEAAAAMAAMGIEGQAFSASNKCIVVTKSGTREILFEFDCGSDYDMALLPISDEKAVTTVGGGSAAGYRYYGGFAFRRHIGENITVINYVDMEDYTKGVIPYEMSSSWPKEALKAQAMCARTYAAANINQYGSYGFDMTNDTYSQVYRGTNSANATTDAAVDETADLFVTYNGKLCTTYFFSSDGGATESSENVWANAIPYLRGKEDPFEADIEFTYKSWHYEFTPDQIASKLKARGYSIGTVTSIEKEFTEAGNMKKLTFKDNSGKSVSVTKGNTYGVLGLPAIHFDIEYDKNSGKYIVDGGGWGHNVGMSQWGAYSMASVHDLNYAQIICFYYTNVDLSRGVY